MPKFVPPRGQRRNVDPYNRLPQARFDSLWAANAKIKGIKAQLDTVEIEERYWMTKKEQLEADYDLINDMVEIMLKHVKRLLDGLEDRREVEQEELLGRLQMMNIRK